MNDPQQGHRQQLMQLTRDQLVEHQLIRVNELLSRILPDNKFYAEKLKNCPLPVTGLEQLGDWPTTTKDELLEATAQDSTINLTFPLAKYTASIGHPEPADAVC